MDTRTYLEQRIAQWENPLQQDDISVSRLTNKADYYEVYNTIDKYDFQNDQTTSERVTLGLIHEKYFQKTISFETQALLTAFVNRCFDKARDPKTELPVLWEQDCQLSNDFEAVSHYAQMVARSEPDGSGICVLEPL